MYTNYAECLQSKLSSNTNIANANSQLSTNDNQSPIATETPNKTPITPSSLQNSLNTHHLSDRELITHLELENKLLKETVLKLQKDVNHLINNQKENSSTTKLNFDVVHSDEMVDMLHDDTPFDKEFPALKPSIQVDKQDDNMDSE